MRVRMWRRHTCRQVQRSPDRPAPRHLLQPTRHDYCMRGAQFTLSASTGERLHPRSAGFIPPFPFGPIRKGLHKSAQGCEARATLGKRKIYPPTPKRVAARSAERPAPITLNEFKRCNRTNYRQTIGRVPLRGVPFFGTRRSPCQNARVSQPANRDRTVIRPRSALECAGKAAAAALWTGAGCLGKRGPLITQTSKL
jgi:hypothetical protein